jgi:16S rRNA (guanine527-N7)-methyltransferase
MTLADGIAELGLTLPTGAEGKLEAFMALLAKWNRSYNLTAIRDPDQMVTHHLLDSLAVLPHLGPIKKLADVGSGAGLPGLTLAISRPELRVTSVEASHKKVAFQQQAKIELKITNVSIHCGRVERLKGVFDAVISRAFADLAEFVGVAGHLTGRLLAMKGAYPATEIARLPDGWRLADAVKLNVPGLVAERHLLILERT